MNRIMKVPIGLVFVALMLIVFTFVDYTWVFYTMGRAFFCGICIVGAGLLTAMNSEIIFWEYHE